MKGKKETIWAVVITTALITAGLFLSCGDDDDAAPTCQNACNKLINDCEGMFTDVWATVEDCVEDCEGPNEKWKEAEIRCILDVSCIDLGQVCMMCGWACGVISECELEGLPGGVEDLDKCYEECKKKDDGIMFDLADCVLENMLNCVEVANCF
jgi:hypothetical protein